MSDQHPIRDALHEATHRVPGVPPHVDQPAGHQGTAHPSDASHGRANPHHAHRPRPSASHPNSTRAPRVLVSWQRRIAALVGADHQ